MRARVKITCNKTGESVIVEDDFGDDPDWMWTEGNYGCDCNRFLFFERARGNSPELDECPPCGETLYSAEVLFVTPDAPSQTGPGPTSPAGE